MHWPSFAAGVLTACVTLAGLIVWVASGLRMMGDHYREYRIIGHD